MKDIIAELEDCFKLEISQMKIGLKRETDFIKRREMADNCIQRLMGAAQLANRLGGEFQIIESMFEHYKEEIRTLEENLY